MATPKTIAAEYQRAIAAEAALGDRITKEVNARVFGDTSLADRVTTLEEQVKALIAAAGGSGGGITPVPNDPPPPVPPTTDPTGSGVTLPVGTSQSAFLTAVANLSYDYILLAGGDYPWNMVDISVDRTANPLLIQPVAGQRVRFTGSGSASYGIFRFGVTAYAKHIEFDGRVADGFLFDGITLQQAGIFAIFGSDYLTIRNYTTRNIRRTSGSTSIKSYSGAYVSSPYAGRINSNLVIDRGTHERPPVNRDISAHQVASELPPSGPYGPITISNQTIIGHAYAGYFSLPITDLQLDTWALTDCGDTASGKSIRVRPSDIDGAYQDIVATGSLGLENASTGTFTDGGGNSGI